MPSKNRIASAASRGGAPGLPETLRQPMPAVAFVAAILPGRGFPAVADRRRSDRSRQVSPGLQAICYKHEMCINAGLANFSSISGHSGVFCGRSPCRKQSRCSQRPT